MQSDNSLLCCSYSCSSEEHNRDNDGRPLVTSGSCAGSGSAILTLSTAIAASTQQQQQQQPNISNTGSGISSAPSESCNSLECTSITVGTAMVAAAATAAAAVPTHINATVTAGHTQHLAAVLAVVSAVLSSSAKIAARVPPLPSGQR